MRSQIAGDGRLGGATVFVMPVLLALTDASGNTLLPALPGTDGGWAWSGGLCDLDQVAAGVVEDCRDDRAHFQWLLGEPHAQAA